VAASDYWQGGPVRRYVSGLFNPLLIDREKVRAHNSPIDMILREIGTEYSIIVFPEGGRSLTGEIGSFKSGLYYLGKKRPDLELMPVYLDNMNRIMPKGEFLPLPLLSCITIGARFGSTGRGQELVFNSCTPGRPRPQGSLIGYGENNAGIV
jgi:1-acyl-sn-glycerol-3-phosphate acyltransferase